MNTSPHPTAPRAARQGSLHTASLLRLAWRNLWRQRRRTILLVVVVAYATLATVFYWGFTEGFTQSMLLNQARYLSAPVLITSSAYGYDPDPVHALSSLDFSAALANVPGVRASAPRLEFFGLLRSPYSSQGAGVRGVEPGLEPAVSNLPASVTAGRMLENPGEVVLGEGLAARLDVRLGERLVIDASSLAGPQASGLQLVGLISSGLAAVDEATVLIHLEDARSLTGVATATGLALDVPRGQERAVAARVQTVLPEGLVAADLMTLLGVMGQQIESSNAAGILIGGLFALLAALAVTSTVLVSVLERQREFGMMAAIGMAPPKIARMVVIEAVAATTIGWLVGLVLGYSLTWVFSTWNIFGPLFAEVMSGFATLGIGDEIYTRVSPVYALYAAATIVFAMIFALLIPARQVAKLHPVTAMRAN